MNQDVIIANLNNLNYQKQCLSISNSVFGKSYHHISFFKIKNNTISIVALKNKKAVGFLVAHFIDEKIVKIDSIGVSKNFQRQKVGTKLMSYFINSKLSSSIKIIAHAWKNTDGINAEKLNLKFGLKPITDLGRVWINDCNKSFQCPYYKEICKCESIEFSS